MLEIGTVVELKMMNGECLDPQIHGLDPEYTLEANWEVEVLELWFTVQMRDFLQVPRECIGFVWSNDHDELDIVPQAKVSVTVCWGPAPDDDDDDIYLHGRDECFICGENCEDADFPLATVTREGNCRRCSPSHLCARCRLYLRDGTPVCLLCVTHDTLSDVSDFGSPSDCFRRRLLNPDIDWPAH